MTQDNAYAFASFAVIGGHDYEGESFDSMRICFTYEGASELAHNYLEQGYDYALIAGVYADGSLALDQVTRIADDEPSSIDLT
jgi:hypothetical protein